MPCYKYTAPLALNAVMRISKQALRRAVIISEQTGLYAVVLDALNERAKKFYLSYGFKELLDDPFHLYLPIETIIQSGMTGD